MANERAATASRASISGPARRRMDGVPDIAPSRRCDPTPPLNDVQPFGFRQGLHVTFASHSGRPATRTPGAACERRRGCIAQERPFAGGTMDLPRVLFFL